MTWADIKRGDEVFVLHRIERARGSVSEWTSPGIAVAVGPQWITVEVKSGRPRRLRFQSDCGSGEHGTRVHTARSLDEEPRRQEAIKRMERSGWRNLPLAALEAMLRLVEGR